MDEKTEILRLQVQVAILQTRLETALRLIGELEFGDSCGMDGYHACPICYGVDSHADLCEVRSFKADVRSLKSSGVL